MTINEFLKANSKSNLWGRKTAPQVKCRDGFQMSVQASTSHYCIPKSNSTEIDYTHVEVGFPSGYEPTLETYRESSVDDMKSDVFCYVPVAVVDAITESHGGIIGFVWG